ncbi:ankyrin repeat domain-containing protein 26-like isoform X8 [Halichoerus grypus]
MKKFFSFGSKKGGSSFRVTSSLRDRLGIRPEKRIGTSSFWGGYNIRDKDLRKIHKVASMGDVRKLQEILFFGKHGVDERDKMNRTALHLACANGHPDVVAVLVERKCQLDLFDKDYRTALMKAVQSQNERCVTILLEHGADPNLTDIAGNTALHYAAVGSNTSIAEKLLLHHANTEVRNKDELTPLLLAVSENKPQMVEFLIEKEANVHAVDKLQSSRQLIAEHREEKLNNYLQSKNAVADKSSEEESLSSISIKPGTDDSWPTSDDEDFNFDIKTVPKPNLRALMNASEQFKNVGTQCDLTTPGGRTLSEHDNSDYGDENIVGLLYKPPFKANDFSCPAFSKPSVKSLAGHGVIKAREVQPATGKEDNGINITQSAPQEQTVKDNLTSADRAYKSNSSVTMSALGLGEEEDGESPWDSESISESVPKKDIKHLFGAADPKGPRILNEQVEDSPKRYPYVKRTVEVKDSVPNKTVEVKEKQTSKSVFSCWKSSVGLCHSNEPCQRSRDLRVDDKGPSVSQSVTKSQSASTEFGRTTFIEKEKINNIGVVFLLENDKLHDLCKSELPESREHKPDLPAELDLERTSEEEQKRLDESENNHLQINEEKKRHQSNGMAVLENVYAVAAGLTQQRESGKTENHLFPVGKKEDSDGPAKKTSHEKKEVKKQINFMDDLDLTESSGTASEDSKLPCSNYMSCKSLIVQVGKDCKDSSTLRKIQDAILPYKKSVELKKNQCKQLKRKNKEMEDKVNGLQKELSETKELKLQLEHQKMKWEQELSGLRLEVENAKLKVTVKKQAGKIEQLQENLLSTSLSNDEKGQIKKYIELKQCLECSLDQEMKKNGELEKEITRFKKLLNVTRRKLSEYEDGELTFPGNSKTNQIEMESQINMLKQKVDDLTAKLETASSKCLYLDANNQLLTQELTSMKEMQKKYEKLEKNKKKLEQVVNLRSQVEFSMVEFSMVEYSKTEQYKWELEERTRLDITEKLEEANLFFETQLASQESLGQIRETNNTLIRNHMEIRIKDLELELSRMKSFQDFYEKEFEKYKHLYLEELKVRVSLENELNKTNEKLAETSTKLLVEKQQKKSLINPITMSPVLELPSVRNMNNSSLFNRYVAPRESLVIPTSSSWPTKNGIETFLTKMQQEMERNITRELEADAAEFESDSWCMTSSLEPTYESHANDDLLVKSSKAYLRILKKKYMI